MNTQNAAARRGYEAGSASWRTVAAVLAMTVLFAVPTAVRAQRGNVAGNDVYDPTWEIEVTETSREVIFSNKERTHFATETHARGQRSYSGLYTSMHETLDDYVVSLDDVALEPVGAERVRVWPWLVRREHPGGTSEELLLPDALDVLLLRVTAGASAPSTWSLAPWVDQRWIWEVPRATYEIQTMQDAVLIRRTGWQPGPGAPPWLAVVPSSQARWVDDSQTSTVRHPRDAARKAMASTHPHRPGRFEGEWPAAGTLDVAFALGSTPEDAVSRARRALAERDALLITKRNRIVEIVGRNRLSTGDAKLDRAYAWSRASLDVLVMNVRGRGIYAGFHWFPNYWGRDTFICLPGATLVTEQWEEARDILFSFLRFQLVDRSSRRLGRLPNIVQPGDLQYAGVDGTWWYVRAAFRYLRARRMAGRADGEFEAAFRPALALMIEGAERMAVDDHGLLTHGDGETWMDAGGEANPYSPRGDRAVEVQALYYNALRAAAWLESEQGAQDPSADRAARYVALAERTRQSFRSMFWDAEPGRLADHLNPDGTRDLQVRPNTILALFAVEEEWPPLLSAEQTRAVVDLAFDRLVLPYGVTSLDPADPAFHPRHLDLDRYYYDEAYHNGDVWLWLTGPMIQALCRVGRVDDARRMLDPLVEEILHHGAVGSLREIRDGGNTGLTEEFGGATSQAWSLAEMIRSMHEDLAPALGWKVETPAVR